LAGLGARRYMRRGKRKALERYERTAAGRFIIDVTAPRLEDLYQFYDRTAPYVKRDLDPDLADYLIACARELRSEDFTIRLTLERAPADEQLARIRRSVANFFLYLVDSERDQTRNLIRRSVFLLGIGLGIFTLSVWANSALGPAQGVVGNVLAQGLTVAAWVSLWESLAVFLIDWGPHRRSIRLYERLANAPLIVGALSAHPAR
jgi:hypothetical protein